MLGSRLRLPSFVQFGVLALSVLVAPLAAQPSFGAVIVVGTNDGVPNVFPYGSPSGQSNAYKGEYQQAYTSSAFSGPVTISAIGFATTGSAGLSVTDTFTLGLSTTSASLSNLSTTYASNIGPDSKTVFSGTQTITSLSNGTFDFLVTLATPFIYDPSKGNLLLDVNIASSTGSSFVAFEATNDAVTSRVYNSAGTGTPTFQASYGLVTAFTVTPLASVPEPGTIALGATFVAGVLLVRRRSAKK